MAGSSAVQLAAKLSELLEMQMRTLSGRGIDDLTDAEITAYKQRNARISQLRSEIGKLARPM
jgi:predicted nuclease of predicted toxin-antitoxin system